MICTPRKLDGLLCWLCLLSLSVCVPRMLGQFTMPVHVGPVYTGANDTTGSVGFPKMKVVVTSPVPHDELPQPGDLTLVEDGVESGKAIAVEPFGSTGFGVAAVVAVDVSGSMAGGPLRIMRDSLYKFASDARPQDAVAVMTIADDAVWEVTFDAGRASLRDSLQKMHTRGHLTRLYDGLASAINGFDSKLPARRELIVITDGHDEGSRVGLEDVVQLARQQNIAIDAIGLTRSEPRYLNDLSLLAQQTGGSFHQVHSDEELQALIGNGMAALKASPVATFQAERIQADGKPHTLGVIWAGTSEHRGETSFTAPDQAAAGLKHRYLWPYAVAALLLAAAVIGAVAVTRQRVRRGGLDPSSAAPYSLGLHDHSVGLHDPQPGAQEESSSTPIPTKASFAPESEQPDPSSVALQQDVPRPVSPDHRKTQIIGIFQPSDGRVAALEVISGTRAGQTIDIPEGEFSIGRSPENDLPLLDDKAVSSRHASIVFEEPMLILVDHRSTNGTRINGELLRGGRHPLCEGDRVQIGLTVFRVLAAGSEGLSANGGH